MQRSVFLRPVRASLRREIWDFLSKDVSSPALLSPLHQGSFIRTNLSEAPAPFLTSLHAFSLDSRVDDLVICSQTSLSSLGFSSLVSSLLLTQYLSSAGPWLQFQSMHQGLVSASELTRSWLGLSPPILVLMSQTATTPPRVSTANINRMDVFLSVFFKRSLNFISNAWVHSAYKSSNIADEAKPL